MREAVDSLNGALTTRTVALASGPASVLDVGEGRAVVFVHGLPGAARDARWLVPHLQARVRLVAVDLPGFGDTPVSTRPDASPEGRAAFVLDVVDALGLDRPAIVGHSMGGVVAVAAVAARPGAFSGLGLLACPGLRPHATFARFPRRTLHLAAHGPWARWTLPRIQRLFARAGFRNYPDAAVVRTIDALRATVFDAHVRRLRALSLPTLAAWCADDPIVEPEILAELATALPPGPRLVWARGGHVPQKAYAAELADALVGWTDVVRDDPRAADTTPG